MLPDEALNLEKQLFSWLQNQLMNVGKQAAVWNHSECFVLLIRQLGGKAMYLTATESSLNPRPELTIKLNKATSKIEAYRCILILQLQFQSHTCFLILLVMLHFMYNTCMLYKISKNNPIFNFAFVRKFWNFMHACNFFCLNPSHRNSRNSPKPISKVLFDPPKKGGGWFSKFISPELLNEILWLMVRLKA